jgi:hypothetical protein
MALEGMFVEYAGWRIQEGMTLVKWADCRALKGMF